MIARSILIFAALLSGAIRPPGAPAVVVLSGGNADPLALINMETRQH